MPFLIYKRQRRRNPQSQLCCYYMCQYDLVLFVLFVRLLLLYVLCYLLFIMCVVYYYFFLYFVVYCVLFNFFVFLFAFCYLSCFYHVLLLCYLSPYTLAVPFTLEKALFEALARKVTPVHTVAARYIQAQFQFLTAF